MTPRYTVRMIRRFGILFDTIFSG